MDVLISVHFIVRFGVAAQRTNNYSQSISRSKGKHSMDITYSQVGDYLLPNLRLSDSGEPLGRYGMLHKAYLREEKPALYAELLLTERLYPLCREIDKAAADRLATIADREAAHEVILSELVYC
jgi:hypothetical protein